MICVITQRRLTAISLAFYLFACLLVYLQPFLSSPSKLRSCFLSLH